MKELADLAALVAEGIALWSAGKIEEAKAIASGALAGARSAQAEFRAGKASRRAATDAKIAAAKKRRSG